MDYQKIFHSLSDHKRILILKVLNQKGLTCVCEMTDLFNISQSKLSYHLKLLLDTNLIIKVSDGKWNYYNINNKELKKILSKNSILDIFKD